MPCSNRTKLLSESLLGLAGKQVALRNEQRPDSLGQLTRTDYAQGFLYEICSMGQLSPRFNSLMFPHGPCYVEGIRVVIPNSSHSKQQYLLRRV
jgi:hypothetical protein